MKSENIKDSQYILCTGLFDEHDYDLNYYKRLFEQHISNKMIYTNPSLLVALGTSSELFA